MCYIQAFAFSTADLYVKKQLKDADYKKNPATLSPQVTSFI